MYNVTKGSKMNKHIFLSALLIFTFSSFAQTFQSNHFRIQKLADGVYAAIAKTGGYAICNAGIIDLGDAVLVFDPFMTPEAADDLKKASQQLIGHDVKYVVNSHFHNDHIGGDQVFEKAFLISTERTRELIAEFQPEEIADDKTEAPLQLEKINNQDTSAMTPHEIDEHKMWKGYFEALVSSDNVLKTILPDLTFSDQLIIHGTKRTVKLLSYGTGHTESDLFLYIPDEQIAFLGDLLFVQNQPWLGDGDPDKWENYLDSIAQLNIKIFVPGHGPVGTAASIDTLKMYFDSIHKTAMTYLEKGILPENDPALKTPPPFDDWFLSIFYKPNVVSEYNRIKKNKIKN